MDACPCGPPITVWGRSRYIEKWVGLMFWFFASPPPADPGEKKLNKTGTLGPCQDRSTHLPICVRHMWIRPWWGNYGYSPARLYLSLVSVVAGAVPRLAWQGCSSYWHVCGLDLGVGQTGLGSSTHWRFRDRMGIGQAKLGHSTCWCQDWGLATSVLAAALADTRDPLLGSGLRREHGKLPW